MEDKQSTKKKSKLTPKEIAQKRLAKSELMKIDRSERTFLLNKENVNPQLPPIRKSKLVIHDKNAKDFGPRNPFDIPDSQRVFTKSKGLKKTKPVPFIMSDPHTICDVDETFYKKVEGRPLRQFDDIKVYMRNIRDITLFKANTAYLKDQILQVDATLGFEMEEYKAIETFYFQCKDSFVQFAKESYNTAKEIQILAAAKSAQLDKAIEELESLSFHFVAVRNKLGVINITFETLAKYRQFLNSLAPVAWREENDETFDKEITFGKASELEQTESVYSLFKYIVPKDVKAVLFFTKPRQMIQIFDNLSRQCLTYMEIDVVTSNLVTSVIKSKNYLKAQAMEEVRELEDYVETFRGYVKFMEIKEQEFKAKFEKILLNEFQELYASYDVSKLFTCVQYTNTQVFQGPEDPKDSITSLQLLLERDYIELTSGLDNLNQEVVKEATNEFFSQDLKMMKLAHLAQRNLRECDILSKALFTSFERPRRKNKV